MNLSNLKEFQGDGCIGKNVRNVYKLSDTDYCCQLDLITNNKTETIDYYTSTNDEAITGQWVISQILSGKAGKVKTKKEYDKKQFKEQLDNHNIIMKNERQQLFETEYKVLESKFLRDEATKEELINKAREIRESFPYLEEIDLNDKKIFKKFPYLKLFLEE